MNQWLRLVVVLLFVTMAASAARAALTCSFTAAACGEATIMRANDTMNAHVATASGSYPYRVCCVDTVYAISSSCSGTIVTPVLLLDQNNNAHVERVDMHENNYPVQVCLSSSDPQVTSIACNYRQDACLPEETCVASMEADTNAHLSQCTSPQGLTNYSLKVCCQVASSNMPPTLTSIRPTPICVKTGASITVTSVADDPDVADRIKLVCGSTPHANDLCNGPTDALQNPSCTFPVPASWTTTQRHPVWCYVRETTTSDFKESSNETANVTADYTPPVVSSSAVSDFNNQYYGQFTVATITTQADDIVGGIGCNVSMSEVHAGPVSPPAFLGQCSQVGPQVTCAKTADMNTGTFQNDIDDLIFYRGYAEDPTQLMSNWAYSVPTQQIQLCNLTSITATPSCGPNGCVQGDTITIQGQYSGQCSLQNFIQVDASSASCSIERNCAGNPDCMAGMNQVWAHVGQFGPTPFNFVWSIPAVPDACRNGVPLTFDFAGLYDNTGPPAGQRFDSQDVPGTLTLDANPVVDITTAPAVPGIGQQVTFIAQGSDNYHITAINIFVDDTAPYDLTVPVRTCNAPASPLNRSMTCTHGPVGPYPAGTTVQYRAVINDSMNYTNSVTKSFTIGATGPPVVSVSHAPAQIGINTPIVTYTADASDDTSVQSLELFVNAQQRCVVTPGTPAATCPFSEGPLSEGTIRQYSAEARDNLGNVGIDPLVGNKSFTSCSYDSVALQPQCGADDLCEQANTILVSATKHGACPEPSSLQTDARDAASKCRIQNVGGEMQGIGTDCAGAACADTWTIPVVPFVCQGRTVAGTDSTLRDAPAPAGTVYALEVPTGSFTFLLLNSTPGLIFNITINISDRTPNYRDVIDVNVSCRLQLGAQVSTCDNSVTKFMGVTIEGVDYLAAESWNQNNAANYQDTPSGTVWRLPVNTVEYNAGVLGVTDVVVWLRFGSLNNFVENTSSDTYIVNFPPTIDNVQNSSNPTIGQPVTFSADIINPEPPSDQTQIDRAYVCKTSSPSSCETNNYCRLVWNGVPGNTFVCTDPSLPAGSNYYWIYANDTEGAWNMSQRFDLLPQDAYIVVNVAFPDANISVPLTAAGEPNYTRGMPIRTHITASVWNATSGLPIGPCNYQNCDAAVDGVNAVWDFFSNAWSIDAASANYLCGSSTVNATVTRTSDSLEGKGSGAVYIDCTPRIVVRPIDSRVALGQANMRIFNITVYNPQIAATFNVTFLPQASQSFVKTWVEFRCAGGSCGLGTATGGEGTDWLDQYVRLSVADISSETAELWLISAGRAGSYPLTFRASPVSATSRYTATAGLQIYAEALPEFELWQLVVAGAVAAVVAALLLARKKRTL